MKKVQWVRCPSCSDEWTKLRPCGYLDDEKRPAESSLCVVCAETLVAWDWLMDRRPLPGALSYTGWKSNRYLKVRMGEKIEQVDQPQNAFVVVEFRSGDSINLTVVARSEGTGRPIRFKVKGTDEEHTADNIFALRSKILHTVPF